MFGGSYMENKHHMKCPIDGSQLVMTDRSGVEIDYCPQCRGVWLDRGELDKIIERSAPPAVAAAPPPPPPSGNGDRDRRASYERAPGRPDDGYGDQYRRKKRGGFLEDLFDF
jgi:Zn-finger nucleic acid-binding protein